MKERGITIILISHNLEHIFTVSDRIAILLSGGVAGQLEREKFNRKKVVDMMMGVV